MVMVKESADTLLAALVGVTSSGKVPVGSLLSLALAVVHVSMSRWCSSYCCLCTYGYGCTQPCHEIGSAEASSGYEDFLL